MVPALVTSASREKSRNRFQFVVVYLGRRLRNSSAVTDHRYRTKSRRSTTSNQPINKQKQHRANYRCDKTGWLTWLVPPNYSPQKSGHKRAGNTEQNGNKQPPGSGPGIRNFAIAPTINPITSVPRIAVNIISSPLDLFACWQVPAALVYGSSISCAERISSLSRILFSNFSSGALSRFSTVSAVPPA